MTFTRGPVGKFPLIIIAPFGDGVVVVVVVVVARECKTVTTILGDSAKLVC